jgi:CRISPR-associated exonuclease Cas4
MTAQDPVDQLLATASGEPVDDPFRVTGVMMQYYHVCERELWFASRHLEIDRENANVVRGTQVDDSAYADERENLSLGMISLDLLQDGRVVEV